MRKFIMAAAVVAATVGTPAIAQQAGAGLITVQVADIDILRNSLNNNDVDILNHSPLVSNNQLAAPINVQVPIGIAANVCGTTVALLTSALAAGDNTCDATTASRALGQAVAKQKLNQRSGK
jgi:hypothetical protein